MAKDQSSPVGTCPNQHFHRPACSFQPLWCPSKPWIGETDLSSASCLLASRPHNKAFLFSQKPVPQYWPLCASGSKPHSVTETFHRKGFSPKSHCGGITLHYMLIHFRNVSLAEVRGIRPNKAMAPFLMKLTVEWGIQTRNDTAVQWQSNGEDQSIIEGKAWIRWGPPAHWSPSSRL